MSFTTVQNTLSSGALVADSGNVNPATVTFDGPLAPDSSNRVDPGTTSQKSAKLASRGDSSVPYGLR